MTEGDARWLRTTDGVDIAARRRGDLDAPVALVVAHGFTMHGRDTRLAALAVDLVHAGRAVYTFDFRGHGHSSGMSTLGDLEILDLDAVVALARRYGHQRVVVVGASMGAFVALRHAALLGGVDAVIGVSTPARWGVSPRVRARLLLLAAHNPAGRRILSALGTNVAGGLSAPASPARLAGRITVPVALVHGDRDRYVPIADSILLHERLAGPKRLVILPGFGHAESAFTTGFAGVVDSLVDELLMETGPRDGPGTDANESG